MKSNPLPRAPRILLFTETFLPTQGGSERVAHNLAVCLSERGFKVTVFAPAMDGDAAFDAEQPYDTIRSKRWAHYRYVDTNGKAMVSRASRIFANVFLAQTLARLRFDAMIAMHLPQMALAGRAIKSFKRKPFCLFAYGEELETGARSLPMRIQMKAALSAADTVFAISRATAELVRGYGVEPSRIALQHPVPDAAFFELVEADRADLRSKCGYDVAPGDTFFVTISRLVQRKGIDTALHALAMLKADGIVNWKYVVGGTGEDRPRLRKLAEELGIDDFVSFPGAVDEKDKRDLLEAADLFLMPNRALPSGEKEGFGIVFLEAALRGTPSIGGRSGGTSDAVEHGTNGWLVSPNDPAACYARLREFLNAKSDWDALRERTRAFTHDKFRPHLDHDRVVATLKGLLRPRAS